MSACVATDANDCDFFLHVNFQAVAMNSELCHLDKLRIVKVQVVSETVQVQVMNVFCFMNGNMDSNVCIFITQNCVKHHAA